MPWRRLFASSVTFIVGMAWLGAPSFGQADQPLATTIHGSITSSELSAWCLLERRQCLEPKKIHSAVQDLAVRRELSRRFRQHALVDEAFESSRSLLLHQIADRCLRRELAAALPEPSNEQLRALFDATPRRSDGRQWRLLNLYRRFPDNAETKEKEALRREMQAIRQRIAQGEDFSQLARQVSESATRLRGGAIGLVTLDRLAEPAAKVLAQLGSGDLSPVIETKDGLTLLKVIGVVEEPVGGFEKARTVLRKRWRQARLRTVNEHLDETLLKRLEPGSKIPKETLLLAARAAEARARGLLDDPEVRRRQGHAIEKLEAQTAANVLTRSWIPLPTPVEIRTYFESLKEPLVRPRRRWLESLRLPIDSRHAEAFYQTALRLGEAVASGALLFEQLAQQLEDSATRKDLGWKTDKQVWLLGLNVEHALRALPAGGVTPWVQEGQTLHLVRVVAIEPTRALTFEEARPQIEAVLQNKARRRAGLKLFESILEEVSLEFTTGTSHSGAGDADASETEGASTR